MFRIIFGGKKETFKPIKNHTPGSKREQYSNFTLKTLGSGDLRGSVLKNDLANPYYVLFYFDILYSEKVLLNYQLMKTSMSGLLRIVSKLKSLRIIYHFGYSIVFYKFNFFSCRFL